MKSIKLIALFVSLVCIGSYAQPGDRQPGGTKDDKIQSMKIAFLTQRLDLTPEEAQKFWPVFNQFESEMKTLRGNKKDASADFDSMNDNDAEKFVDDELVRRQKELDVLKKYHAQFKQVLPIRKVGKLYTAQEDFKRELLKRLQERREGGKPGGQGGRRP
ncbi:MAG: hypothetical protein ABI723_12545 [Bacteroidia bacterium]